MRRARLALVPSLLVLLSSVSCTSIASYHCGEYRSPEARSQPVQPLTVGHLYFDNGTALQIIISKESYVRLSGQWATRSQYMWRRYCAALSATELQEISDAWELVDTPQQERSEGWLAQFDFGSRKIGVRGVKELQQDPQLQRAVRLVLEATLRSFPKRFGKDISAHPLGPLVQQAAPELHEEVPGS